MIAFNGPSVFGGEAGVVVDYGQTSDSILSNSIFANAGSASTSTMTASPPITREVRLRREL